MYHNSPQITTTTTTTTSTTTTSTMGTSLSKEEEERRQLYAKHGVLLPPSFTTTATNSTPEDILRAYTNSPLTYHNHNNNNDNATVASRILGEYMDAGIHIGAALPTATTTTDANIRACLHPYPSNNNNNNSTGSISGAMMHRISTADNNNSMYDINAGCGGQFTNSVLNGAGFIALGNAAVYCSMTDTTTDDATNDTTQQQQQQQQYERVDDVIHQHQQHGTEW
uniref:Uncharacterized protein n=1 Tax=Leptocylindrus danicus TaxID=163516 RepID=A0A7S2NZ75_9STRA|mmetsp:Transcript_19256/g.28680  ORF Transcript_19256/g.28680 Transcript_19256/m.28680 type:complete len:225 (+) Transcript_19256:107-781(+)